MSRLQPTTSTIKKLFSLSKNECAHPECLNLLVDDEMSLVGQICHICAAEEGGERYVENMTNEERRDFDNLILLCANCHIKTNDTDRYSIAVMHSMKLKHELESKGERYKVTDEVVNESIRKIMKQENKNYGKGIQVNTQGGNPNIKIVKDDSQELEIEGIKPFDKNFKRLIERVSSSSETKRSIPFRDEVRQNIERDVMYIATKHLKFRKENGRIIAEVESYEKENNIFLNESNGETQEVLRGFLKKLDKEKNQELKKLIIHNGQRDPAIITCDGFLVNGNRRKMILEELYIEKHQDTRYEKMKVIILPEDTTELEIQQIENKEQLQGDGKSEYIGLRRAYMIRKNIEKGYTLKAQLRDDSNFHDLTPKEFNKAVRDFENEFLKPLDCADRYLKKFKKEKHYGSVSDRVGDPDGRWEAFKDYSKFFYGTLDKPTIRQELGIAENEIGKVEDFAFKGGF